MTINRARVRTGIFVAAAAVAALAAGPPAIALKPLPQELKNSRIRVSYDKSVGSEKQEKWLRKREFLERMRIYLAPLRLPQSLLLRAEDCDEENAYYEDKTSRIRLCYQYIEFLERIAPKKTVDGVSRDDVIIGGLASVMMHESGHAVFDIFRIPVLGREEDAADQMAALAALDIGGDFAKSIIRGMAYALKRSGLEPKGAQSKKFADTHGTDSQRFYNTICLAYGKDPVQYQDIVAKSGLPPQRLANCENEYRQVEAAYRKTVLPNVDLSIMQKVREHPGLLIEKD
jgi:Putative metallopeptidase